MELTYANKPRKNWKGDKIFGFYSMIQSKLSGKELSFFPPIKGNLQYDGSQNKYASYIFNLLPSPEVSVDWSCTTQLCVSPGQKPSPSELHTLHTHL